ncbi:MAG: sugar phosphate isomerase/epimerase family protein, partial [Burkholderiales bacterium]
MMTSRRDFIVQGGLAFGGAAAALSLPAGLQAYPLDGILGVQSWELRTLLETDLDGTLKALAGYGYKALDLVINPLKEPSGKAMRQALERAGMICHNAHMPFAAFEEANYAQALAVARELGLKSAVIQAQAKTTEEWKTLAGTLSAIGARTRRDGLQLGYHNHATEFRQVDGQLPFDLLVNGSDPEALKFQIDVGNAAQGGADPVAYLARYPSRYYSMH